MKHLTYNINGIRAGIKKGLLEWISIVQPHSISFQEVKAQLNEIPTKDLEKLGYYIYLNDAEKKGYSGVATITKEKPLEVTNGIGVEKYDKEGRVQLLDFEKFSILNVYMPSGSNIERQSFKLDFLKDFETYVQMISKKRPNLIVCGDFNICHKPIDINNPIRNKNTPGFTIEEREWMDDFVEFGFTDAFRKFNNKENEYTWWTYRSNARSRNVGWRIDYQFVSKSLESKVLGAKHLKMAYHSDHCPVQLDLDL